MAKPADFESRNHPPTPSESSHPNTRNPPAWVWFGVGCLLIIALLVIFVLPAIVAEYELPLERRVDLTVPPLVVPAADTEASAAISPFEQAQRARLRREAQDVLAELLESQEELERKEVGLWAPADYDAALQEASMGDDYYRDQDFAAAGQSYTTARDALAGLLEQIPDVVTRTLDQAGRALEGRDSALAEDRFSLALLLEPGNETARIGLERARALDEVNLLFERAEGLLDDGDLEAALAAYRQITSLDSYNEPARQKIAEVSSRIAENEFARIMSSGYALLEDGDPEQAIAAFERAAAFGINQEQAQAAITQTRNEVANVRINAIREAIDAAETGERWQEAVDGYDEVLSIDPSLTFATAGRDYADKRSQLDSLLVSAIDNPHRLADDRVYEETRDVYFTGRSLENPGPVLAGQLDELQVLLENSQVAVTVQLRSDNLTQVTLLRIAELGNFEQTSMSLKPGRYVAVGRRVGYREVREEFTVGFGLTPDLVEVRCTEPVVAANGR